MKKKSLKDGVELSEQPPKRRRIIEVALNNPDLTQSEVAERVGASSSYVSSVHQDYLNVMIPPDEVSADDINEELYEKIVAGIKNADEVVRVENKYDLDLSQGGSKEVDVAVWLEQAGHRFFVDIECKFHNDPIEQDVVSALIRDVENSTADKGVVISRSGFQSGAVEQARESNTELYTLRALKRDDPKLQDRIMEIQIKVNVRGPKPYLKALDLSLPNGDPVEEYPEVLANDPRLFSLDRIPTGETIFNLGEEGLKRSVGEHRIDIGDRLVEADGKLFRLDRVLIEVVEEDQRESTHSVNAYDDYDLYMKDELLAKDQKLQLFTIEKALASFAEISNSKR
jgi:transcriptional regulator with XRE-family HTH domain